MLVRLALVAAGCALALAAGEIAVRTVMSEAIFSFRPLFRPDPALGYVMKPGVDEYAFGARVRGNGLGFRGAEWSERKAPGTVRVALVGDSHAFGFGVEEGDAVAAQLARALRARTGRPAEVLPFALPGYNAAQERACLERVALRFAPDAVVVFLCDNDHRDPLWVDEDGWLRWGDPQTERDDPGSRIEGLLLPGRRRWGFLRQSRLLTLVKVQWMRARLAQRPSPAGWDEPVTVPESVDPELAARVQPEVERMVALCRARGVPVVLALHGAEMRYRRLLAFLGAELGVPCLDLVTRFPEAASWEELVLRYGLDWDPHLGPEGHRRWGEAMAEAVAALLP